MYIYVLYRYVHTYKMQTGFPTCLYVHKGMQTDIHSDLYVPTGMQTDVHSDMRDVRLKSPDCGTSAHLRKGTKSVKPTLGFHGK